MVNEQDTAQNSEKKKKHISGQDFAKLKSELTITLGIPPQWSQSGRWLLLCRFEGLR